MQRHNVYLKGVAATGTGFENWDGLKSHLTAGVPLVSGFVPRPQGAILPNAERRRASVTIKLAVDVAQQALQQSGMKAEGLALVFASSNGDTDTIHHICDALATPERFVSPTRFHNSVHNAPAGYWSIASGSMQPSSSICAWNDTFAAALLEAAVQCLSEQMPVLLTVFDTPFPAPLYEITPGHQAFGVALVLDASPAGSIARLSLGLDYDGSLAATPMSDTALENIRCDSSAARSLPLLAAIAADSRQEVVLGYTEDLRLKVVVEHC